MKVKFWCDEMYPCFGISEDGTYEIDISPELKEEFKRAEEEYLRLQNIIQGLCWKR